MRQKDRDRRPPAITTNTMAGLHSPRAYGGLVRTFTVAAPTLVALGGTVLGTVANEDGRATTGIGFPSSHELAHGVVPLA